MLKEMKTKQKNTWQNISQLIGLISNMIGCKKRRDGEGSKDRERFIAL